MSTATPLSLSAVFSQFFARLGIALPSRPAAPQNHKPNRSALAALAVLIAGALIWHFSIAQPIIAVYSFVPLFIKMILLRRIAQEPKANRQEAPSRWVMALLTVFSIGMILLFYGGWNGQVAGISFIVLLISLKFLEFRELRDYFVVCVILYFLAACAFLFDSSIISIVLVSFYCISITTTLHLLSTPTSVKQTSDLRDFFKSSMKLLATALPLAIILFFFFPRIQGDFGFLPSQDQNQSTQALDDRLIAGDMAVSAFDNSLAFRAQFDGTPPPPNQRYWRVKVLDKEIDFQWALAPDQFWRVDDTVITGQGDAPPRGFYNYTILHQQSSDPYLPYLDYVRGFSDGVLLENTVIRLRERSSNVFIYSGSAERSRHFLADLGSVDERYLQSTSQASARMQTQLQAWRSTTAERFAQQSFAGSLNGDPTQSAINAELARTVLRHFAQDRFSYTLLPPILDESSPLEDFLFNTQSGYCEHYASAFTTIMRWLEVPARVVVGYQGGELNDTGSFIEVRYSDAHAWSELWIDGQWVRYDPTAAISPDRIEFGMQTLMEMWDGFGFSDQRRGRALANFLNPQGVGGAYRILRQSWSNMSFQWNKWIVNYDQKTQRELLDSLGFEGLKTLSSLIFLILAGIGALVLAQFIPSLLQRERHAEEKVLFNKLMRKLHKRGFHYEQTMTTKDVARQFDAESETQSQQLAHIMNNYESIRYANIPDPQRRSLIDALRNQIKEFQSLIQAAYRYIMKTGYSVPRDQAIEAKTATNTVL